jgi:hypothetical protein
MNHAKENAHDEDFRNLILHQKPVMMGFLNLVLSFFTQLYSLIIAKNQNRMDSGLIIKFEEVSIFYTAD